MTTKLPAGVLKSDLKWPTRGFVTSFDLWFIEGFGWVIPTLSIAHRGQRTYGVCLGDGSLKRGAQVRVGMGPHVRDKHTVYVSRSREKALQPFLDLKNEGAIGANKTRDRISTRRMRRFLGGA